MVLGSIGTIVYRARLTASTGHAEGSWVDGFRQAGGQRDAALLHHVQAAFTSGFRAVGVFGVVVMAVVLALRSGASTRATRRAAAVR